MAFTKSLASEQSRDITLKARLPWFQIQTQTLTPTHTPNHTITLTQYQALTRRTEKWNFFPRSGENWSRDHQKAASKNEKHVGICFQISKILKSEKILGEWISACVHKWWVQHEQLPKVVFDKLYSPFLIGNLSRSLIGIIILFIVYARSSSDNISRDSRESLAISDIRRY